MSKIKDILKLNIDEDIKNVIDLEDNTEIEIQHEIENYIVTDGLGTYFSKFINIFTSNIKENGVWISGFYGSGKSYFAKMLGYLISNKSIVGTTARDRFIPRLNGVKNQSIIENEIRSLNAYKTRVILFDIAKQNTNNGLAFVLFQFFLKSLDFLDDVYGYIEFTLFLDGKYDSFCSKVKELTGENWRDARKSAMKRPSIMRRTLLDSDFSEADFNNTINTTNHLITNFSANKLKDELEKYFQKFKDETIVFLFDEASEAIAQKKFSLLDLEGLSEALSSIKQKVWTIAIAQEKLDDVINNNNISKNQLIKVTDRFKTKIHLESTDVDVIIKNRLLSKNEKHYNELVKYFKSNEGLITESTNLNSNFPTKTTNSDDFATYYPFHKYQFALLQKFLFSSNALVASQIAARGMIITTFDVLKKQLKDEEFLNFCSIDKITKEAQTAPPVWLIHKYDTAEKITANKNLKISGDKLLKVIHFINNSEHASATLENISKSYITDINTFYEFKPLVKEALELLVDSRVLLFSNNKYTITSDIESRLLDEMQNYIVELFIRKNEFTNLLKKANLFNNVASYNENSVPFNFNITTDDNDDIKSSSNKHLNFTVYSIYKITENRHEFVENIKSTYQNDKTKINLIPDNKDFNKIDKLIEDIKKYTYIEEKYSSNNDTTIKNIVREFSNIKNEKNNELQNLIKKAYLNATILYLFELNHLSEDNFNSEIKGLQIKLIKNVGSN